MLRGLAGEHLQRTTWPAAILTALFLCSLVLLVHIRAYWFLTDDAFISFRYARNLAHGYGLVFNPGFERVEGYTNFLWVVILAAIDALLGWAPDRTANWLSAGAGLAVWVITVAACWRRDAVEKHGWAVLLPALWLALNRSFAVWSTGGLETKLFELLIVTAVIVTFHEMDEQRPSWWRAAALLALASLTRPDGILIAAALFGARGLWELQQRRLRGGAAAAGVLLFVAIVGAHFAFRLLYYAEWLPNTYYAKLGGDSWWDMGGLYFRTFLLEYGAPLWVPLLLVGVIGRMREGRSAAAWVIAAAIVPHAIYVAYCGGDHFEYRPLDVYFPLLAILFYDGLIAMIRWQRPMIALAWGVTACAAIAVIPWTTHLDFPNEYRPGFPGQKERDDGNRDLLDMRRHARLAAIPGAARYIDWYNRGIQVLSAHFIGLRQEEHRLFLTTVEPEGKILARLISDELLPRDTFIAIPCVGAIPYFSDLRTFDMLGLTDKHVARQPLDPSEVRLMAHSKVASYAYMDSRHVEIIAPEVHIVANSQAELDEWRDYAHQMGELIPVYISRPVLGGHYVFGIIRKPAAAVQSRFPALRFAPAWE